MSESQPVIVPRSDHTMSRGNISPNVLKVLYRLRRHGHTVYLVGGVVRDLLLGRQPKDHDVVTDATPNQVRHIFRNCRLIGRRFRLAHLHFADEIVEVATFRRSVDDEPDESMPGNPEAHGLPTKLAGVVKTDDGLILRDNLFGTPEQDAWRRDFTINALFYNIEDFSIIDYVGGLDDLHARRVRAIGDPRKRFVEDPVRMVRAIRFAAMLDFEIEADTRAALLEFRDHILKASSERMYEETLKLFLLGAAEPTYRLMRETGLFERIYPVTAGLLDDTGEGSLHAHLLRATRWIDERRARGEAVSPPLMYALMFGALLERRVQDVTPDGGAHTLAWKESMLEFAEALSPCVRIPRGISLGIREILDNQWRFPKTRPRNARRFVHMTSFAEAWEYFLFTAAESGDMDDLVSWWHEFLARHPAEPATAAHRTDDSRSDTPRRRGRRRRRGRGRRGPRRHPTTN